MLKDEYYKHRFKNMDLTSLSFAGKVFSDCIFEECRLSANNLQNARMHGVVFSNCKISGISFTDLNRLVVDISFYSCDIKSSNFTDLKLNSAVFSRCVINDCDFVNTELKNADFRFCDLNDTLFHNTDLTGAVFEQAVNYNINPNSNKIKKAVFSLPEAVNLLAHFGIILK